MISQIAATSPLSTLRISCEDADQLVAQLHEAALDLDIVAGEQLALVGDVLLHGGHAAAGSRADSSASGRSARTVFQFASSNLPTYHMTFMWPM